MHSRNEETNVRSGMWVPERRMGSSLTDTHGSVGVGTSVPKALTHYRIQLLGLERSRWWHACQEQSQVHVSGLPPTSVQDKLPAGTLEEQRQLSRFFFHHQCEVLSADL